MSSCQPARSRSNTNQCRPARSRSNNPCQARPNTPRQPRNGQAQTVGGYEEEEEEYSAFRIGCALGVLFVILLGSYNMYSSFTKNVNDNYPYIKPRPPLNQFPYDRPPMNQFPNDRPPIDQPSFRPPIRQPGFDVPPVGRPFPNDRPPIDQPSFRPPINQPGFDVPPVGRPYPNDRPPIDQPSFRPPIRQPGFDKPIEPIPKFPGNEYPKNSFEKSPKEQVPNERWWEEKFDEDDYNDPDWMPGDDYDLDTDTSFDSNYDKIWETYDDNDDEYFKPTLPGFDEPVKPIEKFPGSQYPKNSFEEKFEKWWEEDFDDDEDYDYGPKTNKTNATITFDDYDHGPKNSFEERFEKWWEQDFDDDEQDYDYGPKNSFEERFEKWWEEDFDDDDYDEAFVDSNPKFEDYDDEPWYTIEDWQTIDGDEDVEFFKKNYDDDITPKWGSPKKVDDGKYDPNWDRPNFVKQDNKRMNFPGQNRKPIRFGRNPMIREF